MPHFNQIKPRLPQNVVGFHMYSVLVAVWRMFPMPNIQEQIDSHQSICTKMILFFFVANLPHANRLEDRNLLNNSHFLVSFHCQHYYFIVQRLYEAEITKSKNVKM